MPTTAPTTRGQPALPEPSARWGQGRHSPGGSASSARGSSTAGGPRHHLLPPPWPRRRPPTAPAAPPTDTTVGARPPSARRGPELRRLRGRPQPLLRPLGTARGPESARRGTGTRGSLSSVTPGRGRRGVCYCQLGPSAAEHAGKQPAGGGALRTAQPGRLRRSGSHGAAGTGAVRSAGVAARLAACQSRSDPGRYLRFPKVSLTFWPRQTDPAEAGAAGGGRVSAVQLRALLGRPKCRDSTEVVTGSADCHLGHSYPDRLGGRQLGKYAWHLCKGSTTQNQADQVSREHVQQRRT